MTNAKVPYKLLIQILFLTPKTQIKENTLNINNIIKNHPFYFEVDRRVLVIKEE